MSVEDVCRDFFTHLTPRDVIRKTTTGQFDIPAVVIDASQKAARGVQLLDLANWIDLRRAAAQKECDQLQGRR